MCDCQRLRSACAYAQPDQSLCWPLENSMNIKLLTEHHFEFLRLKRGRTGLFESTLVKMSHCWKSHVAAKLLLNGPRRENPCPRRFGVMVIYSNKKDTYDFNGTVSFDPIKMSQQNIYQNLYQTSDTQKLVII